MAALDVVSVELSSDLDELFLDDFLDEDVFLELEPAEDEPASAMSALVLVASAPAWSNSAPSLLSAEVSGTSTTLPTAATSTSATQPERMRCVPTQRRGELVPARISLKNAPTAPLRNGVSIKRYEASATATTISTCASILSGEASVMSATGFMSKRSG